jgi:uncharacterized protein YoxC
MTSRTPTMKEDIAVIKTEMRNTTKVLDEIKDDVKDIVDKIDCIEKKNAKLEERVSNLNIFQASLSVVIGAIASYLGMNER